MQQTKLESFIEQVFNIGSGFLVSFLMWDWVVIPIINRGYLALEDTFHITAIFTVSSLIRSYFWRRFFNRGLHKKVHKLVSKVFPLLNGIMKKNKEVN